MWDSPAFGNEKNAINLIGFQECPKLNFNSFTNEKFLNFFQNDTDFKIFVFGIMVFMIILK